MDFMLLEFSSILMGIAAGGAAWCLIGLVISPRREFAWSERFELNRRNQIREHNSFYRWFEPLIDELSQFTVSKKDHELARHLVASRERLQWKPAEFRAKNCIEGSLIGIGLFLFFLLLGQAILGMVIGGLIVCGYPSLAEKSITDRSKKRLQKLRYRLPFVIDQLALMMEAGAGFSESLSTAVRENRENPIGEEFGEVLRQIEHGRTRPEAFEELQQRLQDDDISEFVMAVNTGEELGTPLSKILRRQADQMRLRRSQWGEKAAAEAQVKIVFPGMLVMIACLLVVITPIILPAIQPLFE